MQEDAKFAQSLFAAEAGNNRKTRATTKSQQMSSINDRENLQVMLDIVTPLEIIEDSEESEDEKPTNFDQLEELEELIEGQPIRLINTKITLLFMDQYQEDHQLECMVKTPNDSLHLIEPRFSLQG